VPLEELIREIGESKAILKKLICNASEEIYQTIENYVNQIIKELNQGISDAILSPVRGLLERIEKFENDKQSQLSFTVNEINDKTKLIQKCCSQLKDALQQSTKRTITSVVSQLKVVEQETKLEVVSN